MQFYIISGSCVFVKLTNRFEILLLFISAPLLSWGYIKRINTRPAERIGVNLTTGQNHYHSFIASFKQWYFDTFSCICNNALAP